MADYEFPVTFTYNHTAGVFQAELPNGAKLVVHRHEVAGKLANALELFKNFVVKQNEELMLQTKVNYEHRALAFGLRNDHFVNKATPQPAKGVRAPEVNKKQQLARALADLEIEI